MAPKKLSDVPYSCLHGLSQILDACQDPQQNWRALAERLEIYNVMDIARFERKALQLDGSPSHSLLVDLSMTGRNIDELFTILYKMKNAEAFQFLKNTGLVSKSLANSLKLKPKSPVYSSVPQNQIRQHDHDARSIMKFIDQNNSNDDIPVSKANSSDLSLSIVSQRKDSLTDDILIALRNKGLVEFSYNEVCSATGNFSDSKDTGSCKLGMGSFGTVYKGDLKNTTFAIKKLNLNNDMQARSIGLSQFAVEVLTLSKYRHPHLLELVGYSLDPRAPCLVYYYMEKGSLANVLSSPEASSIQWDLRLRISDDISKGLVYLHTASEKPLIHRDLKSANVLLTNDYQAKIGDFGLARLGSDHSNSIVQTNRLQGTMGYISPEAARGNISTKTDVYSYGVLMLELLTNLSAFDPNRGYQNQSLVGLVESKLSCNPDMLDIISPKGVKWPCSIAKIFLEISQSCFEEHNLRPTASSVLQKVADLIQTCSSVKHFDEWIQPGSLTLDPPRKICENRKTILVLTRNKHESNLIQGRIGKLLDGESRTSSLRAVEDIEFHFVTLYDAIVIVCNPLSDFSKCLQDSINRFNPHLVISSGLCHGVRGKVNLGDVIISEKASLGNVTYSVSKDISPLIQAIQQSETSGEVLWKLPGLLPKSPLLTASQTLLWISKLIMEVNSEDPSKSDWLKDIEYVHDLGYDSTGFLENMKIFHRKYPCLRSANMTLVYDPTTNAIDPDINLKAAVKAIPAECINLKKKKFVPKLHVGSLSPSEIPYEHGSAFIRNKLCPEEMLGCDMETLELYSMCVKTGTPCVSIKSVCGFADPYEDARYNEIAANMSALGVVQFIATYLTPGSCNTRSSIRS